jgi:hypothetical protein
LLVSIACSSVVQVLLPSLPVDTAHIVHLPWWGCQPGVGCIGEGKPECQGISFNLYSLSEYHSCMLTSSRKDRVARPLANMWKSLFWQLHLQSRWVQFPLPSFHF